MAMDQPEINILQEYVDQGARMLDERAPGWRAMINRDYLDVASTRGCIVGQLVRAGHIDAGYSDWESPYTVGINALGIEDGTRYGLDGTSWACEELRPLWLAELDRESVGSIAQ
jgi:hypothetical protein